MTMRGSDSLLLRGIVYWFLLKVGIACSVFVINIFFYQCCLYFFKKNRIHSPFRETEKEKEKVWH